MEKITTAVILASGLGTRLRPLTNTTPKPLIELNHKLFIEYVLDNLVKAEIKRAVITSRYFHEKFLLQIGNHYKSIKIDNIKVPLEPVLGTGGDLKKIENYLPDDEFVLVCNADIISNVDLRKMIKEHFISGRDATISVVKKDEDHYPNSIGVSQGKRLAACGKYYFYEVEDYYTFACQHILKKEHLKYVPKNKFWGFFGEDDIHPNLIAQGKDVHCYVYPKNTYWEDVGTHEKLKAVKKELKANKIKF